MPVKREDGLKILCSNHVNRELLSKKFDEIKSIVNLMKIENENLWFFNLLLWVAGAGVNKFFTVVIHFSMEISAIGSVRSLTKIAVSSAYNIYAPAHWRGSHPQT